MHFKKSSHFFLLIYVLCTSGQQITEVMTGFIDALKNNFADRFDHFSIPAEVRKFVKDPFCLNVEGEFASKAKELVVSDEASLQLELIEIQSSDDLRQSLQVAGSEMFWTHEVSQEKLPNSRGLAIFVHVWLYLHVRVIILTHKCH